MSILRVDSLRVSYPGSHAPAVDRVSFEVAAGEAVGIVGESGAGKSQTGLSILGLLPANAAVSGSIHIAGTEVIGAREDTLRRLRTNNVSMIFQDPATALNPYVQVGKQLRRILLEHKIVARKSAKTRCIEMLERVGLREPEKQYHAYPHQLSGGMRQRVLIAAALIGEPDLIVADEPTTALDVTVQARILQLLNDIRKEYATALLLITHDLAVISQGCDRLIVMDKGAVIEHGPCKEILAHPSHPHTVKLVEAVLQVDAVLRPPRQGLEDAATLVQVESVSIGFRDRRGASSNHFVAVDAVDLELKAGETLAIVGESGSGKTSLARSIAGLLPGFEGRIRFAGEPLAWRVEDRPMSIRRQMQMVFQDPVSSLDPAMRVDRILLEPLRVHARNMSGSEMQKSVTEMLDRVGLHSSLALRYPHELSGGQAQRVAIARALMLGPAVLICDEALTALDGTVRREILKLLTAERERSGLSLVLITHDLGVVREISDRVYVMHQGKVCETATNERLFSKPEHAYTKELLRAVPRL